jgi:hypothetical protein
MWIYRWRSAIHRSVFGTVGTKIPYQMRVEGKWEKGRRAKKAVWLVLDYEKCLRKDCIDHIDGE